MSLFEPIAALEVPPLSGRINDRADILSATAESKLESYLAAVEKASGAQIALLTIPLIGRGTHWSRIPSGSSKNGPLGRSGKDDGVLLLVTLSEKKIRIEVGYGLEGDLTDALSGHIIRNIMVPGFKSGDFEVGIAKGLQAIGGVVTGEAPISQEQIQKSGSRRGGGMPTSLFALIFIFIFLLTRMGSYSRYRRRGISPGAALFMGMMLGSGSRYRGGGFGSTSGGFSGGGFGGGFSRRRRRFWRGRCQWGLVAPGSEALPKLGYFWKSLWSVFDNDR